MKSFSVLRLNLCVYKRVSENVAQSPIITRWIKYIKAAASIDPVRHHTQRSTIRRPIVCLAYPFATTNKLPQHTRTKA